MMENHDKRMDRIMQKKPMFILTLLVLIFPVLCSGQEYRDGDRVKVAIARNPFGASESIIAEGLIERLESFGCDIVKNEVFSLNENEEIYRGWARSALISRHLADLISANGKNQYLVIGLLGSCADLPGILGGLQHMGPGQEDEVYHLAAYAAAAGIACELCVPASASGPKLAQMAAHGAEVIEIKGKREYAALAAWAAAAHGAYYASHVYNPSFLTGTETFAFEVWEQLGQRAPSKRSETPLSFVLQHQFMARLAFCQPR